MLYFFTRKSDTLSTTKKYLADISPYGRIKRLRSIMEENLHLKVFRNYWLKIVLNTKNQPHIVVIKMAQLSAHSVRFLLDDQMSVDRIKITQKLMGLRVINFGLHQESLL